MERQKTIRTLGIIVMIASLMFMVYKFIKDTNGDTDYIALGLAATVIGMFLVQFGADKEK